MGWFNSKGDGTVVSGVDVNDDEVELTENGGVKTIVMSEDGKPIEGGDVEEGLAHAKEGLETGRSSMSRSSSSADSVSEVEGPRSVRDDLVLCNLRYVAPSDVTLERRVVRDLNQFADNPHATIVLDIVETTPRDIVSRMLRSLVKMGHIDPEHYNDWMDRIVGEERVNTNHRSGRVHDVTQWHLSIQGNHFILPMGKGGNLLRFNRAVCFARLANPLNLGSMDGSLTQYLCLVLSSGNEGKQTKSVVETARRYATMLSDQPFQNDFADANSEDDVKTAIRTYIKRGLEVKDDDEEEEEANQLKCSRRPLGGIINDIRRRYHPKIYLSDFTDGLGSCRSINRYISTIVFLYLSILAPSVTFGALNNENTKGDNDKGDIGVIEVLVSQTLCGLTFAFFSGQPLIVIRTTGPLTVYISVLVSWSKILSINFLQFYAWTGIWTAIILVFISLTELSVFIKWCGRFTEEIFACLISSIFVYEGTVPIIKSGVKNSREVFLMGVVLFLGVYLIASTLLKLKRSVFLIPALRSFLADFGPPIAICIMTAFSQIYRDVDVERVAVPDEIGIITTNGRDWLVPIFDLPIGFVFLAIFPAILLTTLFFIDQNVSSLLVNRNENKLKKGAAFHLDMFVVAVLVFICSMFGLPWTHAALPDSPLHARQLADIEVYEANGATYERVIKARETRITGVGAHILMGLSILAKDGVALIPMPALYGFLLYLGITALDGNQLWERLQLWFLVPAKYQPTHYVRRVPLRIIHAFTLIQLACLIFLWFIKSNFYLGDTAFNTGLLFPLVIASFIPLRHWVLPCLFKKQHLDVLTEELEEEISIVRGGVQL